MTLSELVTISELARVSLKLIDAVTLKLKRMAA